MKKNIPLIVLAFVVVIGGALWISMKPPVEPSVPTSIAPLPIIASSTTPTAPASAQPPSVPSEPHLTPQVTGQTIWRDITADNWNIVFKVQTSWKVSGIYTDDKKLSQVSVGGTAANYFVSRNVRIAEPSKLAYTTTKRTIAGKNVSVHFYKNPSTGYAAYEYFSFVQSGDTYYFQIKEMTASAKEVENFIDFIAVK